MTESDDESVVMWLRQDDKLLNSIDATQDHDYGRNLAKYLSNHEFAPREGHVLYHLHRVGSRGVPPVVSDPHSLYQICWFPSPPPARDLGIARSRQQPPEHLKQHP